MALQTYIDYLRKAGTPLSIEVFDDDWQPIGPLVRRDLVGTGVCIECEGKILLIDRPTGPVEEGPTAALARLLLIPIAGHYHRRPTSRDTTLEALNALAIVTAYLLRGTAGQATEWFQAALRQNLQE